MDRCIAHMGGQVRRVAEGKIIRVFWEERKGCRVLFGGLDPLASLVEVTFSCGNCMWWMLTEGCSC